MSLRFSLFRFDDALPLRASCHAIRRAQLRASGAEAQREAGDKVRRVPAARRAQQNTRLLSLLRACSIDMRYDILLTRTSTRVCC